jgi:hypothetical protein
MSLSDDELLRALHEGMKIPVPYFGGQEVELFFEDDEELLYFGDVLRSFLALTEADKRSATRHVFAYFEDFVDDAGVEWVEEGMKQLAKDSEEIWRFVYPTVLSAQESWDVEDRDRLRKYAVLEGNCGWEQEHGILMSWRDGWDLVKVSGFDGHATWGHAYNDLSKDASIYYSPWRPERCTKR